MELIHLYLLGAPRVERAGLRIGFDTRKAIALLAYLAVSQRSHQRDAIAAMFWPEADQNGARAALRRTLSVLRSGLGEGALAISRDTLGWIPAGPILSDVEEYLQSIDLASRHTHPSDVLCGECLGHLEKAAGLYRDHFMAGFSLRDSLAFDDWQFEESEELRRRLERTLERLVHGYVQRGDYEAAIRSARRWLSLDNIQEAAHCQLMLCLAWSNQRNAALQQYRECVRILERELGVSPLEETTRLYQAILENRLPGPPAVSEDFHVETKTLQAGGQAVDPAIPKEDQTVTLTDDTASLHFPLVGRSAESQNMLRVFNETREDGNWLMVSGEPGVGKTRLVEDFLEYVRHRGGKVLSARCFPRENDLVFAPFIDALRSGLADVETQALNDGISPQAASQVGRLVPELHSRMPNLPAAPPLTDTGAQTNFYEAIRQVILWLLDGQTPGVLFIDDLHWADSASIYFFSYLVRRQKGCPVLFLTNCRETDLPDGLRTLEYEAQRRGIFTRLSLGRLAPAYTRQLVEYTLGKSPAEIVPGTTQELVDRLYRETEGLPYFIIEYLRALPLQTYVGILEEEESLHQAWPTPPGVQELIKARLAELDEASWQILTAAAVIGRSFDLTTVQEASGRSDLETLNGLERLLQEHLIEEFQNLEQNAAIQYDFTHDKLRQLVYDETNAARRRLLHRRAAEALQKQVRSGRLSGQYIQSVALHYQLGGQEAQAADLFKSAGDTARQVFALAEAIRHYQAALALGHNQPAELHENIGELHTLLGEYAVALKDLQRAASSAGEADLGRIEQKIGNLHHRRGEWELASSHFDAAEKLIGADSNTSQLASLYADWARTLQRANQSEDALKLAQKALQVAVHANDRESQAKAENILGIIYRTSGDQEEAAHFLQSSLISAKEANELAIQIAVLNNLALLRQDQGQLDQAIQLTLQSLHLCQQMGDRHRQAALLNHLADLYHKLGQETIAMQHLKQAVVIFSEIGRKSGSDLPEIWMLSEW